MAVQKFKMYMVVGTGTWNHGQIRLTSYAPSAKADSNTATLGERLLREVECDLDVPEFDLRLMEIDALERSVEIERADSQVRINILLDRISKLKAITHEVSI